MLVDKSPLIYGFLGVFVRTGVALNFCMAVLCPCNSLSNDGSEGKGLWPMGELVDTCEDVSIFVGRGKRSDQVDMDSIEACIRSSKGG